MKKTYSFRLDESLMQRFKEYVLAKHGRIYEVLSEEVTAALQYYLDEKVGAHTNTHKTFASKGYLKLDAVLNWLRENGYTRQFHIKDWMMACSHTVGADERTIRKYLQLAERLGKIRHVVGNIYELIQT